MKEYLKKYGIKVGAAVLIVAVISLAVSVARGGEAGFFSNLSANVSAPVQRAAMAMTDWLEGVYGYIYKYDQLAAENESLRAQLAQAQEDLRLAADANEENVRLRELLNLRDKHSDFVFESTRIISWDPSNWSSMFTISKGSSSGIELGDCVVTEYNALVGQVVELGDNWANVRTLIDVDISVGALVGEAGNAAMMVGDFALMQEGKSKLTYLTEGTQLTEGDMILTSGKGGTFPQGLEIGIIAGVQTEARGQMPYAIIAPSCDLSSIAQVFVVKDFDITE